MLTYLVKITNKFLLCIAFIFFCIINNAQANGLRYVLETSHGDIVIELQENAVNRQTVRRFQELADSGHYDTTIFHRVVRGIMVQGGGLLSTMQPKSSRIPPLVNEASGNPLKNLRGTLAMARGTLPNSATDQFFINVADNAFLDATGANIQGAGYCVFASVIKGMEHVDRWSELPTGRGPMPEAPNMPLVIKRVYRL